MSSVSLSALNRDTANFYELNFTRAVKKEPLTEHKPDGIFVRDIEDFCFDQPFILNQSYLISTGKIDYVMKDLIKCSSSLIIGTGVTLNADTVIFEGTETIPMQIVSFGELKIDSDVLKIKDLTIRVLRDAELYFPSEITSLEGTFKIIMLDCVEGKHYLEETLLCTTQLQELNNYLDKNEVRQSP